jgi:hypothetical protein
MHLQTQKSVNAMQCNVSNQVRAWHMPDAYLLCVKLRAAGWFGEGFDKETNCFVIGRRIVCRCPAKLVEKMGWMDAMLSKAHCWVGVPWSENQSDRQRMQWRMLC